MTKDAYVTMQAICQKISRYVVLLDIMHWIQTRDRIYSTVDGLQI